MSADEASAKPPRHRKAGATTRVVVLLVVTSVASAAIGLAAGWFVRSPAQVAADAAPPPRTTLTTEVTEGPIDDPLLIPGTVALGDVSEFSPAPPTDVAAVVTRLPIVVGQTVDAGAVLIEVSDRPVIYLTGNIPLLRDLRMGDRGEDVARLQEALAAWNAPYPDGVFGPGTARALRALYEAAGYDPPLESAALRSELVFGPSGTALVVAIGSRVGAPVVSPLVRLTTSAPVVSAEVAEPLAQQLSIGQEVTVTGTGIGGSLTGKISSISGLVKSEDGAYRVPIHIAVDSGLLPEAVESTVEISVASDPDTSIGLLVPLSAIYSDARDGTFVRVESGDDTRRVPVTVVDTGGGQAQITAPDSSLTVGDSVVVGSG